MISDAGEHVCQPRLWVRRRSLLLWRTVRQVLVWVCQERIALPAIVQGSATQSVEWKIPVYHTLRHILTNPVYAGADAFGRRGNRVSIEAGRKGVIRDARRGRRNRAQQPYAMLKRKGDVVTGWHNKLQSAIANVTPAGVVAAMHRGMAQPKHSPRPAR